MIFNPTQHIPPAIRAHWFIFRIREQMYAMTFSAQEGFSLRSVPEEDEARYDESCKTDARMTYVRLMPHPTDRLLEILTHRTELRLAGVPGDLGIFDVSNDQFERQFLANHAPDVLEVVKRPL